jgi:hypothetical protein
MAGTRLDCETEHETPLTEASQNEPPAKAEEVNGGHVPDDRCGRKTKSNFDGMPFWTSIFSALSLA